MMVMVQELGLLLVLVLVAILTYSSLVYFAERDVKVLDNKTIFVLKSTTYGWNFQGDFFS